MEIEAKITKLLPEECKGCEFNVDNKWCSDHLGRKKCHMSSKEFNGVFQDEDGEIHIKSEDGN